MAGYMLTNNTILGVGLTYQYFSFRGFQASNLLGQRIFVRQFVPALTAMIGQSYLTAQIENFQDVSSSAFKVKYSTPVLVGLGIGSKLGINLNVLYDLNYSAGSNSPYGTALVVQVGGFFF
jgi:hemolysin activation/secretion protein